MKLQIDNLNSIAIDRFTSTSGIYECFLTSRFEPIYGGLRTYYLIVCYAGTSRVRKIARLAVDNATLAYVKWETWKARFGGKSEFQFEDDIPAGLSELKFSPPIMIPEDYTVLKLKPKGGNIFIRDITPIDEVTRRAEEAGLVAVVAQENKPRPTMGIVLNLGPDPLLHEELRIGDIVMFNRHSGGTFTESGQEYRHLQLHEIIGSRSPDDGLEDLLPPNLDPKLVAWAEQMRQTINRILDSQSRSAEVRSGPLVS